MRPDTLSINRAGTTRYVGVLMSADQELARSFVQRDNQAQALADAAALMRDHLVNGLRQAA